MRLFVAIEVPEDDVLVKLQDEIKKINAKCTYPKHFHLTLKFLGDVDDVNEIKEKLSKINFDPFKMTISGIGAFPNEDYIRVIWAGIKGHDNIIKLQKKIDEKLSDIFGKDTKFHPHFTLARVKFVKDKDRMKKLITELKFEDIEFDVKEFKLIKSELTPKGPVYENIPITFINNR